jgi:hypothetical protein
MVANTGLESICEHANNAEEWRLAVDRLMKKAYGIEAMQVRQAVLKGSFSNLENARKIKALL